MSLTKSTFRFAAGGNFETSTSAALAPGHANKAANSNRARSRAFRLVHLRRAESILTRFFVTALASTFGCRVNRRTARFDGGAPARIHGRTLTKYRARRRQTSDYRARNVE